MRVIATGLEGVVIIEPDVFKDNRGYFYEAFNEQRFVEATGIDTHFVQDNESRSATNVVRGLHFQLPPYAQSKLVSVVCGKILDIAVDIRRGSSTFGQYVSVELSGENHRQLFIPRGFAHGFVVLEGDAVVRYKCDSYYAPSAEGAIRWDDPTLNIDWSIDSNSAILSEKDANSPLLDECEELFDYNADYYA